MPAERAPVVRIAAAGDIHCRPEERERIARELSALAGAADVLLLAGDLTTRGEPEQAAALAEACRGLDVPVFAVLGNHDWHCDRAGEVIEALQGGGIRVLEREALICEAAGVQIGVVGLKGFVGGFAGSHLTDFGEPLLREVYRVTGEDAEALERGLREIALCPVRVVLLHYTPTGDTLAGEPPGIWTYLGSDRLAAPIREHEPDLVLHGHAHAGTFEGRIGNVPVYNVSVPVMGRPFRVFELSGADRSSVPIH
jgi:Icc-related predicted phosphoesterase